MQLVVTTKHRMFRRKKEINNVQAYKMEKTLTITNYTT